MIKHLRRLYRLSLGVLFMIVTLVRSGNAQVTAPELEGTQQVVGLFTSACVQLGGNPSAVRAFMNQRHVPELNPQGRAIFLRDHQGVGFDASNKLSRMALVSEDNGVCTAFVESADISQVVPLLESTLKNAGIQLTENGERETEGASSRFYKLATRGREFNLIITVNPRASLGGVKAILTLPPSR